MCIRDRPIGEVQVLKDAYVYLRRLEHRIQIWEDQQTHYLPDDESARTRLAQSMGGPDVTEGAAQFLAELEGHQNKAAQLFERAFVLKDSERLDHAPLSIDWEPDGQQFPESLVRWQAWSGSPKERQLPEKSRLIFHNLIRKAAESVQAEQFMRCLLYTSPSPRDS